MKVDTGSTQTRLIIAASVAWALGAALLADEANRYSDFVLREWLLPFAVFSAPVWAFWACAWVFNWSLPFRRRTGKQWVQVSPTEASSHPLYGVRGWARVIAVILWAPAITTVYTATVTILRAGSGLPEVLHDYVAASYAIYISFAIAGAAVAVLFHRRSRRFQAAFLLAYLYGFAVQLLDYAAFVYFVAPSHGVAAQVGGATITRLLVQIPASLIWLVYVFRSRRINVTFRHRIRQRDLPLIRPLAEAPALSDRAVPLSYEQTVLRMMEEQP